MQYTAYEIGSALCCVDPSTFRKGRGSVQGGCKIEVTIPKSMNFAVASLAFRAGGHGRNDGRIARTSMQTVARSEKTSVHSHAQHPANAWVSQRRSTVTSEVNLFPRAHRMTALLVAGLIVMTATTAMAQSPYRYGGYYDDVGVAGPYVAAPYAYGNGENRDTGYGQGGTAGLHPTGANVGPGRASMIHSTGP